LIADAASSPAFFSHVVNLQLMSLLAVPPHSVADVGAIATFAPVTCLGCCPLSLCCDIIFIDADTHISTSTLLLLPFTHLLAVIPMLTPSSMMPQV